MAHIRVPALLITVVLGLTGSGCGGSDEGPKAAPTRAATPATPDTSPSPTSYLPVPDGVSLTEQGTALTVGQTATVAWQPRQDTTGVLDVTIDRLEKTTLAKSFVGWKIPPETENATPYFVRATVTNRGDTDLSGKAVPLYIVDAANTLIEATTFASAFKPCADGVFPAAFGPAATAQVCLVYFAPDKGALSAVSFRPTQEFNPITWTGELLAPEGTKKQQPTASATP